MSATGRPRGRPTADEVMTQIAIRLPADVIDEIDALVEDMKKSGDPLVRAERSAVIRSLLQDGLAARKAAKAKSKR